MQKDFDFCVDFGVDVDAFRKYSVQSFEEQFYVTYERQSLVHSHSEDSVSSTRYHTTPDMTFYYSGINAVTQNAILRLDCSQGSSGSSFEVAVENLKEKFKEVPHFWFVGANSRPNHEILAYLKLNGYVEADVLYFQVAFRDVLLENLLKKQNLNEQVLVKNGDDHNLKIKRVTTEAQAHDYATVLSAGFPMSKKGLNETKHEFASNILKNPWFRLYIAYCGDVAVSVCGVMLGYGGVCTLKWVATLKRYRNSGYFRSLLVHILRDVDSFDGVEGEGERGVVIMQSDRVAAQIFRKYGCVDYGGGVICIPVWLAGILEER